MLLGSLSPHNKDLEWRTLTPSARHSCWVLDRPCCSFYTNQCYSSVVFRRWQENPSWKKRGEWRSMPAWVDRERDRESPVAPRLYACYPRWACPVRPGLRSAVLPGGLTPALGPSSVLLSQAFPFLVFEPPPFRTQFPYCNYLAIGWAANQGSV